MTKKEYLSVPEAAARLGVSPWTAYVLCRRGVIPCLRPSVRRVIVPARAFERWLDDQSATALAAVSG